MQDNNCDQIVITCFRSKLTNYLFKILEMSKFSKKLPTVTNTSSKFQFFGCILLKKNPQTDVSSFVAQITSSQSVWWTIV